MAGKELRDRIARETREIVLARVALRNKARQISLAAEGLAEPGEEDKLPTFYDTGASVIVTLHGAVLPPEEAASPLYVEPAPSGLNERQGTALEYLKTYGRITRREYSRMFGQWKRL